MYRIQPLTPHHAPGLRLALDRVAPAATPTLARLTETLAEGLARGETRWVATVAHEVVGWCEIIADVAEPTQARLAIAVVADQRGRGMGGALLARALADVWEGGLCRLVWKMAESDAAALRLAQRLGFAEDEAASSAYRNNPKSERVMVLSRPAH